MKTSNAIFASASHTLKTSNVYDPKQQYQKTKFESTHRALQAGFSESPNIWNVYPFRNMQTDIDTHTHTQKKYAEVH